MAMRMSLSRCFSLLCNLCVGQHIGHAEVMLDGRVRLHVAWNDPIGGVGSDTFSRCVVVL